MFLDRPPAVAHAVIDVPSRHTIGVAGDRDEKIDTGKPGGGPTFDHLALAGRWAWANMIRYCYHLGARWMGGADIGDTADAEAGTGNAAEFYFAQAEFAHGTKLEFLQPVPGPGSEFLRRFLLRNGPGPHHFTFKVPDIHAAIEQAEDAGYQVVNAWFDNPDWQEAFLHPKQSHGIVIQLAQPGPGGDWDPASPLPPGPQDRLPAIRLITHLVADLDAATELFSHLLAMNVIEEGIAKDGRFVELGQGPWRLRLVDPTDQDLRHWLAGRPGRIHAITVAVDHVDLVPDLHQADDGSRTVPPEINQGTRLFIESLEG